MIILPLKEWPGVFTHVKYSFLTMLGPTCHHHNQFHPFHWSPTHENNTKNMLLSDWQFFLIGIADHKTAPTNTSHFCQHCLQHFPRIFSIQIRIKHIERSSRVLSWLLGCSMRGDWQFSHSCWANVKTRLIITDRNLNCICPDSWLVSASLRIFLVTWP